MIYEDLDPILNDISESCITILLFLHNEVSEVPSDKWNTAKFILVKEPSILHYLELAHKDAPMSEEHEIMFSQITCEVLKVEDPPIEEVLRQLMPSREQHQNLKKNLKKAPLLFKKMEVWQGGSSVDVDTFYDLIYNLHLSIQYYFLCKDTHGFCSGRGYDYEAFLDFAGGRKDLKVLT